MCKRLNRLALLMLAFILTLNLTAQDQTGTKSTFNETMRSHDKIYVVMAVCITILTGLILYILRIDRKISNMEKKS